MPKDNPDGYIKDVGKVGSRVREAHVADPSEGNTNPAVRPAVSGAQSSDFSTTESQANKGPISSPGSGKTAPMGTWPINRKGNKPESGIDD